MTKRKKNYTDLNSGLARRSHPDEPDVKENSAEREYWRVMELIPDNGNYTAYDRLEVLMAYHAEGNMKKVAALFPHIHYRTMMYWKNGSMWWKPALQEVREMKAEELDARLTKIIDKSLNAMEDRLENGDEKVLSDGTKVSHKVSFRDLSVAGVGVSYDKRALGRGEATHRTEVITDKDRLAKLQEQFKQIARQEKKVIDGEYEIE